jgi:antitoxin CptB
MMLNENQLVWRCRRGIRELDVLFDRFRKSEYPTLSEVEKGNFQRLLEVQDPVIMDWLLGRYDSDDSGLADMVKKLKALSGL